MDFNYNTGLYASWHWKGGGTAVSNTDGSITSSVSANTTNGFSVVSTQLGTVVQMLVQLLGHGLGSAPRVIIVKNRESAEQFFRYVYHESMGN